eukprot:PLAT6760.2.p1 GENE.PLAT6760.2~~PLAT6760.2.p1  ORF type:complete len:1178 (+),score=446.54 PLAT6760.2:49-3582(+)
MEARTDVAPVLNDDKAQFARGRLWETLTGGMRLSAPLPPCALFFCQLLLWAAPTILGATLSILPAAYIWPPVLSGVCLALVILALHLLRGHLETSEGVLALGDHFAPASFSDVEALEDASFDDGICSSEALRFIVRRPRSYAALAFHMVAAALAQTTVSFLLHSQQPVELQLLGWLAANCSMLPLLMGVAAPEPSAWKAAAADAIYYRPLYLTLFSFVALLSPPPLATAMHVAVACLPVAFFFGLLPQPVPAAVWFVEQCHVVLLGASHSSSTVRHLAGLAAGMILALLPGFAASGSIVGVAVADAALRSFAVLLPPHALGLPAPAAAAAKQITPQTVYLPKLVQLARCPQTLAAFVLLIVAIAAPAAAKVDAVTSLVVLLLLVAVRELSIQLRRPYAFSLLRTPASLAASMPLQYAFVATQLLLPVLGGMLVLLPALAPLTTAQPGAMQWLLAMLSSRAVARLLCDAGRSSVVLALYAALPATVFGSVLPTPVTLLLLDLLLVRGCAALSNFRFFLHHLITTRTVKKARFPGSSAVLALSCLFFPLPLAVCAAAAALGSTVLPLLGLPLLTVASPRALHSWPRLQTHSSTEGAYYQQLMARLLPSLQQLLHSGRLGSLRAGRFFLVRLEKMMAILQVTESGSGYVCLHAKGMELAEPTSCHHVEAGVIDSVFAHAFGSDDLPLGSSGNPRTALNRHVFHLLQPLTQTTVTTYVETKLSLRGVLDGADQLRFVHALFLRVLVWRIMTAMPAVGERMPDGWLRHPIDDADVKLVMRRFPDEWCAFLRDQTSDSASAATPSAGRDSRGSPSDAAAAAAPPAPAAIASAGGEDEWEEYEDYEDVEVTDDEAEEEEEEEEELPPLMLGDEDDELDDLEALLTKITRPSSSKATRKAASYEKKKTKRTKIVRRPIIKRRRKIKPERYTPSKPASRTAGTESPSATWLRERDGHARRSGSGRGHSRDEDRQVMIAELVCAIYATYNVVGIGHLDEVSAGTGHLTRLYNGEVPSSPAARWLQAQPELCKHAAHAFRLATKAAIDRLVMADMDLPDGGEEAEELLSELHDLDSDWHLGSRDAEWDKQVKAEKQFLFALRRGDEGVEGMLLSLREQTATVGSLDGTVLRSIWSGLATELLYFTNDDEERYSIQAHKTLLRNMIVQAAEPPLGYPVYGSGAFMVRYS